MIQEKETHETAAVWPHVSNLTSYSSKMKQTCEAQQEKQDWTHKRCSDMDTSIDPPAKIYLHQFCPNTV